METTTLRKFIPILPSLSMTVFTSCSTESLLALKNVLCRLLHWYSPNKLRNWPKISCRRKNRHKRKRKGRGLEKKVSSSKLPILSQKGEPAGLVKYKKWVC